MNHLDQTYLPVLLSVIALLIGIVGCSQLEPVDTPQEHLEQGIRSYRDHKPAMAERHLSQVIREDTSTTLAYEYRAKARYDLKKYQAALSDVNRAIEIKPNRGELYYVRGNIRGKLGKEQGALRDYQRALKKGVKSWRRPHAYHNQGVTLEDLGDTDQAIQRYKQALQSDSTFWRAHWAIAVIRRRQWKFDQAIGHATRMIELTQDSYQLKAYRIRGQTYSAKGEYEKALQDFNVVLKRHSADTTTIYNRAIALYELGKHQRALNDLKKVYSSLPPELEAYAFKGLLLAKLGDPQKGLRVVNEGLTKESNIESKAGWHVRGRIHFQLGNMDQALEDLNRAIEEIPIKIETYQTLSKAYYIKARILKRRGKEDRAQKAINKAIQINPRNPDLKKFKEEITADRDAD